MDSRIKYIYEMFPNAKCELDYQSIFQLLIAVVLSAQTTDVSVNKATKTLFLKYPDAKTMKDASIEDLQEILKQIGMHKQKAKNILAIANIINDRYDGIVPKDRDLLILLPGVGNKTINVLMAEGFKIPALAVDTHVNRIAKRLKIADKNDSVEVVEEKLKQIIAKQDWIQMHHSLIFFGRYFCKAKQPNCISCKLKDICQKEYK